MDGPLKLLFLVAANIAAQFSPLKNYEKKMGEQQGELRATHKILVAALAARTPRGCL